MDIKEIETRVRTMVEPVINHLGMELDHLEINRIGGKVFLRIFIDKEGGVTIDDCESVSRDVEAILDVEDPIPYSYILEVSSPGLDRPIRCLDDFKKYLGRTVRVVTSIPIQNQTFFIGDIERVGDEEVILVISGNKRVTIPYSIISRARLEVRI
ncbi:MAG: ribosome maturation factor RimP [Thermodesulfovibrionia bacterium]